MEHLKKRLEEIFSVAEKELIFLNSSHRRDFYTLLLGKRGESMMQTANYAAAIFILSADENLWERVKGNVLERGIYFDRIRIGGVTLEQYILFHAAKDVYNGTKHIRLSELTDRDLIPDQILRIIVNAFVIREYGIEIINQEVWDEGTDSKQNFLDVTLYKSQGKAITNFDGQLPALQSDLAKEVIKDPYNFDFLTLTEGYREKELEDALTNNITKFLLELKLRCYIVIDLKVGEFDASNTSQVGTYVVAVNHQLKTDIDNPTIGLIICKTKDNVVAERMKKIVMDKFDKFSEVMQDGRLTEPSDGKVYRLREAILLWKRLGRTLSQEEIRQFKL